MKHPRGHGRRRVLLPAALAVAVLAGAGLAVRCRRRPPADMPTPPRPTVFTP